MKNTNKQRPTVTLKDGVQKAEVGAFTHTKNNSGNWKLTGSIIILLLIGFVVYRIVNG